MAQHELKLRPKRKHPTVAYVRELERLVMVQRMEIERLKKKG